MRARPARTATYAKQQYRSLLLTHLPPLTVVSIRSLIQSRTGPSRLIDSRRESCKTRETASRCCEHVIGVQVRVFLRVKAIVHVCNWSSKLFRACNNANAYPTHIQHITSPHFRRSLSPLQQQFIPSSDHPSHEEQVRAQAAIHTHTYSSNNVPYC